MALTFSERLSERTSAANVIPQSHVIVKKQASTSVKFFRRISSKVSSPISCSEMSHLSAQDGRFPFNDGSRGLDDAFETTTMSERYRPNGRRGRSGAGGMRELPGGFSRTIRAIEAGWKSWFRECRI